METTPVSETRPSAAEASTAPGVVESTETYRLVVGVDFSEVGDLALQQAFLLASAARWAEPHVVHVTTAYGPTLRMDIGEEAKLWTLDEASDYLRHYVERQLDAFRAPPGMGFKRAVTHIRVGSAAEEIAQIASDLDADLVVVGTHGRRGVQRLLLGSVAEGVVRMAHCPVYVVRPKDHHGTARIPNIEAPCPQCIETRNRTGGQELWCEQHSHRHGRRHSYHYVPLSISSHENAPLVMPMRGMV
ncbi:MAG TPA: universal stress protein [Polyangiaceae bacterium]|jgi:nucleotide-binding universal stress UspA family protein